jgi:pyruvate-formate lyase-activating enzyme
MRLLIPILILSQASIVEIPTTDKHKVFHLSPDGVKSLYVSSSNLAQTRGPNMAAKSANESEIVIDGKDNLAICAAAWTHISIEPNGNIFTCCRSTEHPPLGKLDPFAPEELSEIWNGPRLKHIRVDMLQGKLVDQCISCYEIERHGKVSQREILNQRFFQEFPHLINSTDSKGFLNQLPRFFGIRFSNICNFSCRICDSKLSTGWYKDAQALGEEIPQGPIKVFDTIDQVERYFTPYLDQLTWIYFAGGEPLLSSEHHSFIHLLRKYKKYDVTLLYNTNLSTLSVGSQSVLKLWNGFSKIVINASLDAVGSRAEFLRYGQNWASTEENLRILLKSNLPIQLILAPVISIHNLFHLDYYCFYLLEQFDLSPNQFVLDALTIPAHYSIQSLPQRLKDHAKIQLIQFKKKLIVRFGLESSLPLVRQISGLIHFMYDEDLSDHFTEFQKKTEALDKLRKQNFLKVFPEYKEWMGSGAYGGN